MAKIEIKKKICLLGGYGVGKTSLVRRFVYNKFEEKYLSTLGVHISKKKIKLRRNDNDSSIYVELFIWDIANIEKFDLIVNNYLRGAHGAIIVSDISRPKTAESSSELLNKFLKVNNNAKYIFVGNKIDLIANTEFDKDNFVSKIPNGKSHFHFASAKTGENIEAIFSNLCLQLIEDFNSG